MLDGLLLLGVEVAQQGMIGGGVEAHPKSLPTMPEGIAMTSGTMETCAPTIGKEFGSGPWGAGPKREIPMSEALDKIQDEVQDHASESRFNGYIALFVAVVATFMALCNVKDGNVVQAMQQSQAKAVDQWAYYQSKGTKQHIAENSAEMLRTQLEMAPVLRPEVKARVEAKIAVLEAAARKYETEKGQIKKEAEGAGKDYDAMNVHDDQFDLAEACLSVAVALAGVTALTKKRWLFGVAGVFACLGFLFGLAGFCHWSLHSDLMAKLLG